MIRIRNKFLRYLTYGVFGLFTAVPVLATLLPLSKSKEWYIRIFDYPRLQTFTMAVIAMILYGMLLHRGRRVHHGIMFLLLLVIIMQGKKAFPFTPLGSKQVLEANQSQQQGNHITLFICNVLQSNQDYEKVLEAIRDSNPDIVITTESDKDWEHALKVLEKDYPETVKVPQDDTYGMHLFSRLVLKRPEVRYLVETTIPSIHTDVALPSGEEVRLVVVHPKPPFPGEDDDTKERDAEILLVAKENSRREGGVIVAGDFNDVAWSETTSLFQEVSGYLDPRRGRGFYNTYHAKYPIFRWPLDHIFHSNHFRLVHIERLGSVGSDHFPMLVTLSYEPEGMAAQPPVKPEKDSRKEAEKAIDKGR